MRGCLALIGLALASAIGCGQPQAPLRVGFMNWPGFTPLHLAASLDLYEGQPPQLVEYSTSTQVIRAVRNGAIDAAGLTLDEAILLASDVPEMRLVLICDESAGSDAIIGLSDVSSIRGVAGKRIGFEPGALGAFFLSRALESVGLSPDDVELVPVDADGHERAAEEGRVDALVTFDPMRERLVQGGASTLFDSRQIQGEILDVLIVRQTFIDRDPEAIVSLLRGWFRALQYRIDDPTAAHQLIARQLGTTPEDIKRIYELVDLADERDNRRLLVGEPPIVELTIWRLLALMRDYGILARQIDPDEMIDDGPLHRSLWP